MTSGDDRSLRAVDYIDLSDRQLRSLPEDIDFTGIKGLDLSLNPISLTARDFERLKDLRILDLTGTRMKTLPGAIAKLTSLQTLYLGGNSLRNLPNSLSEMQSLETLGLKANQFVHLPRQVQELSLRHLDLSDNRLLDISPGISSLVRLESLILGSESSRASRRGGITQIPSAIGNLTQLRKLVLGTNQLAHLPSALAELEKLELLDVSHNYIEEFPRELAPLILKGLMIKAVGNPLREPLPEVIDRGPQALATYLASLDDAVEQYEAKLLMVGEGNVGKTSLVKRIAGEPFVSNRPTTHGIEISNLEINHPELPVRLALHIWDFGGQEVYRITHQFFFTQRALYIVTWNPRQGQEQDEVEGWLRRIRLRVGDHARIIIVATHADERIPELDYPQLVFKFGDILVGHCAVDTKPGSTA